eukprot:TRINITY_DN4161_c0_g1_i1.p2 TRINITY_DN4161_c0_g1~~TRINITY_DN4161_c0_g1_i1.p2  ORF type:complete len:139 (+),score=55.41 TRINITY_DN4161_c0_g1_i1:63-419(+)
MCIRDRYQRRVHGISGILTRSNCMETKSGLFIKDLRILNNFDLKNTIIIDNLVHSFGFQLENGIPILEWHNNLDDKELKFIQEYLIKASIQEDIRIYNKNHLKLQELSQISFEDLSFN